jgi:16S rRNA (cytosine967-C5)-methyltransferase
MTESGGAQGHEQGRELSLLFRRTQGLLLTLWRRTRMDWGFVTDRLAEAFRSQRSLGSKERRFVSETLFGVVRHARRIDHGLAAAGVSLATRAPDLERLVAYLLLEEGLSPHGAAELLPGVDWQRALAADAALADEPNPSRRLALRHSLPDWLAARLWADHGAEAEALAQELGRRAPMTVRANLLRGSRAELAAALAAERVATHPGELGPWALHCDTRANLFGLSAFRQGRFEVQDEGSQLCAELVAPPPRGLVIDYCAGAGGKTLAIAAMLGSRGRIIATDIDARKLAELRRRARRAGASNVQAIELSSGEQAAWPPALERLHGSADRVLVDAPCTGVGALRRNPEARWRLDPASPMRMAATEIEIASRALALVRPGGRLIYATCSVLAAENREVVRRLLERHPDFSIMPVKEIWGKERASRVSDASGEMLELLPHRHGTDGFFAAVLRRG